MSVDKSCSALCLYYIVMAAAVLGPAVQVIGLGKLSKDLSMGCDQLQGRWV